MSRYVGQTYNIPLEQGGFCHNKNVDTIAPVDMVHPSINVLLNEGGIRKRPGTAWLDANAMSGEPQVMGFFDFRLANGTQKLVRATGNGKIWKDVANTLAVYKVNTPSFIGDGLNDLLPGASVTEVKTFKVQVDSVDGIKESSLKHGGDIDGIKTSELFSGGLVNAIKESHRNATGSNYTLGDRFSVDVVPGGTSAEGEVVKISGGRVEIIRILKPGAGYSVASNITTTALTGSGSGLTVNITELYPGYQVDDEFIVDGGDAEGKVTAVTGGAVTAYEITDFGGGYAIQDDVDTVAQTEGGTKVITGTGFKINVLSLYTGYVVDDTFTVDTGSTLATGKVLEISTKKLVTGYEILTYGAGYKVEDEIKTTSEANGAGFTIDIKELHDTFRWFDGAQPIAPFIPMTELPQDLDFGFQVAFGEITGHTLDDYWTVATVISDWAATNKRVNIVQQKEKIILCNGANVPVTWNGADAYVTNFSQIPADWKGVNYPKQIVLHGRLNSVRGWALGCPENPEQVYVSANDEPENFFQDTVLVFNILTGDGYGIIAGISFGDRMFMFGKNKTFIMDDQDYNTDNWGYIEAQWSGGVAHNRLLVRTPNDLICMMDNGEIYSVVTAQQYGDYKIGSLTRPSFMHEWIKEHINLSFIEDFHAVYDPSLRAVHYFVVRNGKSTIDTCLTYFIDRPPEKAWVVLGNHDFESGYSACSSALVRASAGKLKVYTGSYAGRLWKLGEVNRHDNSEAYVTKYKTPELAFEQVRESKRYDRFRIIAIKEGTCSATVIYYVDGQKKGEVDLDFGTGSSVLGVSKLGELVLGGINILEIAGKMGFIGKRVQLEVISNTANEDFFFSQFLVDFLPIGKRI